MSTKRIVLGGCLITIYSVNYYLINRIKKVNNFISFVIENALSIFPNQKINDYLMESEKNIHGEQEQ